MVEFQVLIQVRLSTTLREHELQFVATVNLQWCPRLWAHADPINAGRRRLRTVRLNRDVEAGRMKSINEWLVELKEGLPFRAKGGRAGSPRALFPAIGYDR